MPWCARVPAKINLHLQVVGRRSDGFHELRTVYQSVALWDEVRAEDTGPGTDLTLEVEAGSVVPAGPENLVLRAAHALRVAAGRHGGARLTLKKSIPVGGGLGGGSADAAATLVLLNEVWDLALDVGELHEIAASLGSDVPFFLRGGLALGTGRGEEVWPLADLEPMPVLLVFPAVSISTAEVFGSLERGDRWASMSRRVYSGLARTPSHIEWGCLANDLQGPVCGRYSAVASALRRLENGRCVHAAMTGSGSCVFAVYRSRRDALRDSESFPSCGVHLATTLTREQSRIRVEPEGPSDVGTRPA